MQVCSGIITGKYLRLGSRKVGVTGQRSVLFTAPFGDRDVEEHPSMDAVRLGAGLSRSPK